MLWRNLKLMFHVQYGFPFKSYGSVDNSRHAIFITCHLKGFCWEIQKERDHLADHGEDARMGSELILGRLAEGV
jgi:hypothetical protein